MRSSALLLMLACGPATDDVPDQGDEAATPAPFALRRLNRAEYTHTMQELLHTASRPGDVLPPDDAAGGFDNNEAALATSPLLVELWEQAAAGLAKEVLRRPLAAALDETHLGATFVAGEEGCNHATSSSFGLFCGGTAHIVWTAPEAGIYRLTATARAEAAGDEPALVSLTADGVGTLAAPVAADGSASVVAEVSLTAGGHDLQFSFDNDYYDEVTGQDRNVYLDNLRIEGPLNYVYVPNPAHEAVFVCEPDNKDRPARDCARRIVAELLPRAWRRPVTDAEIDGMMGVYDEVTAAGDPPEWGVEFVLRDILTSPELLFLVEQPATAATTEVDAWELASRLSYFLWESAPDQALRDKAADGSLLDPKVLADEAKRMLRDPKAIALTEDFAGQWLGMRMVSQTEPDANTFPLYTSSLRASMREEMEALFQTFIGTDRDLVELVTSEWTEVDGTLARFYGLTFDGVNGTQQFNMAGHHRGGWLRQAGILMATSYPTRTTPVRRGVWVLSNLLCDAPPAPPPNVPGFPDASPDAATVRERLEAHRANPACASCHDVIDPMGLPFEHFDGIGSWRDQDNGQPIDATGQLPDGTQVDGLDDLNRVIAADPRLTTCMVEKMFTWAHHRQPGFDDQPFLDEAHASFLAQGRTLDALVTALVTSPSFRSRVDASEVAP